MVWVVIFIYKNTDIVNEMVSFSFVLKIIGLI